MAKKTDPLCGACKENYINRYEVLGVCDLCFKEGKKSTRTVPNRFPNRLNALKRDKYKCVKCGAIKNLEVHHKDGKGSGIKDKSKWNNRLSNLITLCRKCHMLEDIKRMGETPETSGRRLAKLRWAKTTPEQRMAHSLKMYKARMEKLKNTPFPVKKEQQKGLFNG
jgi:hypothetical protein